MGVLHTTDFTLRFSCSVKQKKGASRICFAVSKAQIKLAVDRNLLKRRARHALHSIKDKILPNCHGIFYFKKSALDIPFNNLKDNLITILRRVRIIEP